MRGHVLTILRSGVAAVVFLSVSVCLAAPAYAETIGGALAKAYSYNSELNSARAGVRVTDENVAIAKSGYRPTIAGVSSLDYTSQRGNRLTTGDFGVQIQQLLFDGFQTRNNVRTAEARVRASNESLRNTEQNILFNAASAFMDVIRDRQITVLRARNLEFLEEQVRAARSRFEVGEGTRTDVAQAEASRSAAVAQLAAARAQALSSEAIYHQVIGDEPGKLSSPSAAKGLPKGLDTAIVIANTEHPAIIATEHLVDAAGFAVKAAEGSLLPQFSASASVARNYRNTVPESFLSSDGTFNSASVGLTLTVPIYQGGRVAAQVRQNKESLGQARIEVDVTRDQVRSAIVSAWTQYDAARQSVVANREAVSAAELALSGVIEERKVGQRTTLDVLDAQADVITAQINLVSSERDVVVASYAILSAVGHLSAQRLGLAVTEYHPEEHYNAVKDKWIGLRTPDGR
jgi:outer membrane protein